MRRGIRRRTRPHEKNGHEKCQNSAETKTHTTTIKNFRFSACGILQEREDLLYLCCRGNSSVGRASASQAERRGFESLFPLKEASARMLFCFKERDRKIYFKAMLRIETLTSQSEILPAVNALYEQAFPANERIPLKYLLDTAHCREFLAFFDRDLFVGFLNALTDSRLTNILYLAVPDELRGQGYGSQILKQMLERHPKQKIIVDVEIVSPQKPNFAERLRRKRFYMQNGFAETSVRYAWRDEEYELLVSNGTVSQKEFSAFWERILGRKIKQKRTR